MLGVNTGETEAIVRDFVENDARVTFGIGWDSSRSYETFRSGESAGLAPYPVDVVIAPDGTIAYLARFYDPDQLAAAIERSLGSGTCL